MPETLAVNLRERSYAIRFGVDLSQEVTAEVRRLGNEGRRIAVLTDTNVVRTQAAALETMFSNTPRLAVEPGEGTKSLSGFGRVIDFLAASHLDRGGVLFAVG